MGSPTAKWDNPWRGNCGPRKPLFPPSLVKGFTKNAQKVGDGKRTKSKKISQMRSLKGRNRPGCLRKGIVAFKYLNIVFVFKLQERVKGFVYNF